MRGSADPYRFFARWYDALLEPLNRGLRRLGLRLFVPSSEMAVLDVGCGTGAHLALYRRYGCALHGLDPSPSMLAVARRRLRADATLVRGDAAMMPYANASFDLVQCMLALHEMAPDVRAAVLREAGRVLKPGGRLLLIDYHRGPLRPPKGWLTRAVILLAEMTAGGEHFRNYRRFMAGGALPPLIAEHGYTVLKHRVVGGGPLALFLLARR